MKIYIKLPKVISILVLFSFILSPVFSSESKETPEKLEKIVLTSPFSPLAMPMAYIVENGLLGDYAEEVELLIWNNPDQLRAQMSGGEVDFVSIPSNTASIFYNKGVKLKLLKISIWRVFYIISKNTDVTSVEDLRGRQVFVPFRGDQPDLVFQVICNSLGIDPFTEMDIQYVASPLDIVMNMLGGKAEYGLMIEPAASVAVMKGKQKGIDIERVVDLQEEWGRATGRGSRIPNAGVAAMPRILGNKELVDAFAAAYDEAVSWSVANPVEAGLLAAKYVEGVNAVAFTESLKYTTFESISTNKVKDEIEGMFGDFKELSAASIGGSFPDDGFYYE